MAGGMAGTVIDTALFPLDTIKTRLQSNLGFTKSGGFSGVYSGLSSAVLGSAPAAGVFFVTYEALKASLSGYNAGDSSVVHMTAASCGEISACFVRVPTEVIKQRMQTKQYPSIGSAVRALLQADGALGFYRGYLSTVVREIPFTCIQFPLYEKLKIRWGRHKGGNVEPWEAGVCGSLSGGLAGALTTPLDVVKTRTMLAIRSHRYPGIHQTLVHIYVHEGLRGLFCGIGPRVMSISIGGYIFLGVYEKAKKTLGIVDM
ncbi:mitochondrial carrier [Basidiobolus meristosporus CBS 931.73]|uniref:Mitochondrial carrier n=1 Tax=Basidiobolus meristosporus CBS 931.73 TaxID=1314790 RepID=A0A1Y1XRI5_9FUNG|nr:mitochondrial carrier [Basidiobolus meristosporus CBS 931.73]|eukprot:ORX88347.1 mitochondrial carrier [Basidiobolus meristosporus CBS 931.73]